MDSGRTASWSKSAAEPPVGKIPSTHTIDNPIVSLRTTDLTLVKPFPSILISSIINKVLSSGRFIAFPSSFWVIDLYII
jgi:hypothetical protein